MGKFRFVGTCSVNTDEAAKYPWHREGKNESGEYQSINFTVVAAKNNRANVELFGSQQKEIKAFDNDGNQFTVAWANRNDEDVLKQVGIKRVLVIGTDRHEFISEYDLVSCFKEHMEEINGKRVIVTGRAQKNIWNGKVTDRFQIQNIYVLADDSTEENSLRITDTLYFGKDDVDLTDYKTEKKVYFNGYVETYIDKNNGVKLVPQQAILDLSRLDLSIEKHQLLMDIMCMSTGLKYTDGAVSCKIKSGEFLKQSIIFAYSNGAEEIEFDEESLTEYQKYLLKGGMRALDDFKPKGRTFGERKTLMKIRTFEGTGDFSEGAVSGKLKDMEEMIYVIPAASEETVSDLEKNMNAPVEEKKEEKITESDFSLFE